MKTAGKTLVAGAAPAAVRAAPLLSPAPTAPALPERRTRRHLVGLLGTVVIVAAVVGIVSTAAGTSQRTAVEGVALAIRVVGYAGTLGAVGTAVFMILVHDGEGREAAGLRKVMRTAAALGISAATLSVPLHAAVVTGAGFAGLIDAPTLAAVLRSPFGVAAVLRCCGLVTLAGGLGRRGPSSVVAGAAGAALALSAFVLTGHAATGEPRWLVAVATLLHVGVAGVWAGGLLGLAVVLRTRQGAPDAVRCAWLIGRFSTVAGVSLAALVSTGSILGLLKIGSVNGLMTSGYGRALSVKVVLVGTVVALGAYNRWRLLPAITHNSTGAWSRLLRTVRWELAGLLGVIAATGVLSRLAPPG